MKYFCNEISSCSTTSVVPPNLFAANVQFKSSVVVDKASPNFVQDTEQDTEQDSEQVLIDDEETFSGSQDAQRQSDDD